MMLILSQCICLQYLLSILDFPLNVGENRLILIFSFIFDNIELEIMFNLPKDLMTAREDESVERNPMKLLRPLPLVLSETRSSERYMTSRLLGNHVRSANSC